MQWIFWIIAFVLSIAAGYWVYRRDKQRAVPQPWLTALLRGLLVFLTLLLLLVPVFSITRNETQKPVILLLQDDSRSITVALGNDSATYRKNVQSLADKLSDNYKVVRWGFGGTVQPDSLFQYKQPATDIAGALGRAQEFFGIQNLGAVILATDGRFNQGENPLYQQLSLHSPLYTVALGDSAVAKDMRITQVYANKTVSLNSEFEIRADVIAALCNGYNNTIQLTEAGKVVGGSPVSVNADRYDRAVSFTVKAEKAGLHHYVITAPAADGEKNITNNRKDVFVEVVDEKKNVLIVSAAPHPDVTAIKDALAGLDNYKVTVTLADKFPASLNDYQVVVLQGLPAQPGNILAELKAAKKPVWYILDEHSDVGALNQLQNAVALSVNPAVRHDVLAAYDKSFTLFNLPQNISAVMDKMPPLSLPAGTIKAAPNTAALFRQPAAQDPLPLWLLQQGSPPVAVLLGEGLWRWRLYEYKNFSDHTVIDECIRQTITFLAANSSDKPFRVILPKYVWSDQEAVSFNAYLLNANNEEVNTPDVQLSVTDSAGHKQQFSFERSGNVYKLNIGVWAGGTYTYTAHTSYNGKDYTANGSFVVESVPLELMETGADYPLLSGLAKKYNGSLVPAKNIASLYDSITRNQEIKPLIQTTTDEVPLVNWKWYFFLILLIAVAEWLLRKYWLAQ